MLIVICLLQHFNHTHNVGLVADGTEGTLINAGATLNTLVVVDGSRAFLVHRNSLYLAGILTGALAAYDGGKGANLCTGTTFLAL